jgi:hypothetical protein
MHLDLPGTLSRKGKRLRTQGTAEAVKFRDMVYRMSPDIVYILAFSSPCLAAAEGRESGKRVAFSKAVQPTLQPCRTGWVGEGISQMGKRLLTKGTG